MMAWLWCLLPSFLFAQSIPVSGTVTSIQKDKPIKGVQVEVKGTKHQVKTNQDGYYEIPVKRNFFTPSPATILVFSHKNYITQEIEVVDDQELNVSLYPVDKTSSANFLLGNANGIALEGLPYGGHQLTTPLLISQVPAANITSGLQGKIPGLTVQHAGYGPGQDAYLQLRAANTLTNGQEPLVLVDGIYLQNARLSDFNADDLEKVEVLNGAAASALYGSQGGNGVVALYTKNGGSLGVGETRISYRGEYGFSDALNNYNLNEFTNREIVDPSGPQPVLGAIKDDYIHDTPLPNLKNYQDEILFNTGNYRSHYLSMEGKSGNTCFMVAGQRFSDEGIIQGQEGVTRHNLRVNLNHRAGKRLNLGLRSQYSVGKQDAFPLMAANTTDYLNNALSLTPIFSLQAPNEEDGTAYDWDIDNTGGNITNPLYLRENVQQQVQRSRLIAGLEANLQLNRFIYFDYAATLDHITHQYQQYIEKGYLSTAVPGQFSALTTAGVQASNGGAIQQNTSLQDYFTSTASLRYEQSFLGLSTSARAGFLYENSNYHFNGASGENLAVEDIQSLDNPQANWMVSSEEQQMIGYNAFLVADADYQNKFLFSGAFRMEQSSLFGEDIGWPGFYRVGAAYRISEDIKMKFFQELKLHAATGTAGIRPTFNQRFETYALVNGTLTRQTLGNDELLPARSSDIEIGVTARFLKAFSLQANYVQTTTEDQIVFMPLSGGAGFQGQWRNAGTVEADVYEASLNIDLAKLMKADTKQFSWDISVAAQRAEPVITSLGVPAYQTGPGLEHTNIFLIQEGYAPGTIVGNVFAKTIEDIVSQSDVLLTDYVANDLGYIVEQSTLGTPDERPYVLLDESGNPLVQPIGDINPDLRLGIANQLSFRGLDLYALIDWKIGGDIYNYARQQLYQNERHADLSANEKVAAPFYSEGLYNGGVANEHFVEDGSFVMLREASISYTFSKAQLDFLGNTFEAIQLSLIGRNLFTITDYSGYHPDITSAAQSNNVLSNRYNNGLGSNPYTPGGDPSLFGLDGFGYPARKTFTFSLKITI